MGTMTFIELTVNPFDNVFSSQTNQKQMAKRGAGADSVRRPLRGIEIKDDGKSRPSLKSAKEIEQHKKNEMAVVMKASK